MFADEHVFKKNNRYWELTEFVLRVWAARIVGDFSILRIYYTHNT